MRKIAVIGSGISGLLAAHGLLRAGYAVTLFSDRSAQQWLDESRPTGTAARFEMALAYERELGLNFWEEKAPNADGIHLIFCQEPLNQLIVLKGRASHACRAVDVRMQSARWMDEFAARGGKLVIEKVGLARLDSIAAEHDLTILAAGRSEIGSVFERDPVRSRYTQAQRKLAMITTIGGKLGFDDLPFLPVKFNLLGTAGEAFWVPYFHKDHGPCWNMIFEAKPNLAMDRFSGAKSGEEVLAIGKQVVKELFPWDYAWMKDMQLADPNAWLVGGFAPTVYRPVGRSPGGHVLCALGDAMISHDPIAGQGANTGQKMAKHLVENIIARGSQAFDAAWISNTFEDFYTRFGCHSFGFTNLLLEPITAAGQEMLIAQFGSTGRADDHSGQQVIANAFCDNFNDPSFITDVFLDTQKARDFITQSTGHSWLWSAVTGRAKVMANQLKQKISPPQYSA